VRTPRPLLLRLLAWAASGFGFGALAWGAWTVRRDAAVQGWSWQGLDWLVLDLFARRVAWKAGAAAALVCVVVCGALSWTGRRRSEGGSPRRTALGGVADALGHPLVGAALVVLALLGPRVLARATQPTPPERAPNLLFVLVDTWRADHAGFLGYERPVTPALDRLVERGVVFERAEAQAGWTKPSVATLFTGLLPSKHHAVSQPLPETPVRGTNLPPAMTTFVEVLRARGWDTGMWSNNPNILPQRGFGQGAAHFADYFYHPDRAPDFDPGIAERMLPDVKRWLEDERDASRPFCAYVHVMDPHYPYTAPPEFRGRFDRSGSDFQLLGPVIEEYRCGERDLASVTPEMLQRLVDAYDEEILSVDHVLGPFLADVLERWPDTVVVLCGDHGEEFLEHGQFGHAHSLYEELTHVPLVIWAPGLASDRIATQVRLMDVFPTVLELTGNADAIAPAVQGASLLPVIRREETADRLAPAESGGDERPAWQWRAISDGRWKLLRREEDLPTRAPIVPLSPADRDEPRPWSRLFDVVADPGELRSLHAEHAAEVDRLFEAMRAHGWYVPPEEVLRFAPRTTLGVDGNLELLKDLGYADAASIDRTRRSSEAPGRAAQVDQVQREGAGGTEERETGQQP